MRPLRILLLEDHPTLGPLLSETLALMGHEVCPFVGAHSAALETAVRLQPDLLIVDMALSDARGLAATENGPGAPPILHVFISAHARPPKTFGPGAVAIQMPFNGAQLARAIEHVVGVAGPE